MVAHPTKRYPPGTLVNALLWRCRERHRAGRRPRLVHRLDRETSGVLLVSKTREAHAAVARAMMRGAVQKEYLALVYGAPPRERGRIDLPIADRACTTHYSWSRVRAGARAGLSLLRCRSAPAGCTRSAGISPASARRSSAIRATASRAGRAIADPACASRVRGVPAQALHAAQLAFAHPVTGAGSTSSRRPRISVAARRRGHSSAHRLLGELAVRLTFCNRRDHFESLKDAGCSGPTNELKSGVAHPLQRAHRGTGRGAPCVTASPTGAFVEPITVWDAPRGLSFDVAQSPRY